MLVRLDARLRAPLGAFGWIATVVLLLGGLALATLVGPSTGDAPQLEPATRALIAFDLSGAYPPAAEATSPPGYPLVAALPLWVVEQVCRCDGYAWIGFLTLPAVVGVAVTVAHRAGVRFGTSGSAIVAAGTLSAPGVVHSLTDLYHPQDLLALALLLAAAAMLAGDRGRERSPRTVVLAGVLAGIGVATRQWVALPAGVLLVAVPWREAARLAASAATAAVVAVLPFALAAPTGLLRALAAPSVVGGMTVVGRLPLAEPQIWILARTGPVVATTLLLGVLVRRWRGLPPGLDRVLLGLLAALLLRLVFEPVLYHYYLAAAAVVGLVWAARHVHRLAVLLVTVAALANLRSAALGEGTSGLAAAIALEVVLVGLAVGATAGAARTRPEADARDGRLRNGAQAFG